MTSVAVETKLNIFSEKMHIHLIRKICENLFFFEKDKIIETLKTRVEIVTINWGALLSKSLVAFNPVIGLFIEKKVRKNISVERVYNRKMVVVIGFVNQVTYFFVYSEGMTYEDNILFS